MTDMHDWSWGIHVVSPEEEKERLRWEGFAEKEGFKPVFLKYVSGTANPSFKFCFVHSYGRRSVRTDGTAMCCVLSGFMDDVMFARNEQRGSSIAVLWSSRQQSWSRDRSRPKFCGLGRGTWGLGLEMLSRPINSSYLLAM